MDIIVKKAKVYILLLTGLFILNIIGISGVTIVLRILEVEYSLFLIKLWTNIFPYLLKLIFILFISIDLHKENIKLQILALLGFFNPVFAALLFLIALYIKTKSNESKIAV